MVKSLNQRSAIWLTLLILSVLFGFKNTSQGQTSIQKKWLKIEQKQLLEKVQAIGGWDVLRNDAVLLADQSKGNTSRDWLIENNTNGLPASILVLEPVTVAYYPGKMDKYSTDNWWNDTDYRVVRILIFNRFYTGPGGSDHPPLGLDIICPPPSGAYNPHRLQSKAPSVKYWNYLNLSTNVYEFYGFY